MSKKTYLTRVDPINLPRRLREGLEKAETLLDRQHPKEALELLHELDKKYPRSPDVLGLMANAHIDMQNQHGYLHVMCKMHDLNPNRAEVKLGLAGGYLSNGRLALALQTFRQFLKKWSNHERAMDVQETVSKLETGLADILSQLGLSIETGLEFAAKHEELQIMMEAGELKRCKQLAKQLINQKPDFIPPLNNLSQVYWLDGDLPAAIETAHKVLSIEPDNVHALSNLTRYLFMLGNIDESLGFAERLKESEANAADFWVKKTEALSFIGDNEGVLALLDQAIRSGETAALTATVYHQCAVAAYRNGKAIQARKHWQKALKLAPYFDLAIANLDELKKPLHLRLCPQAFSLEAWLPRGTIDKLTSVTERAARKKDDQAFQKQINLYFDQHPELIQFVPSALKDGDALSRDLAIKLADMSAHPIVLANLKEFALGQNGPDDLRLEAVQTLSKHGVFKSGSTIEIWREGKLRPIMTMGMQINYDPPEKSPLKPAVQRLMEKAIYALNEEDGELAEKHLRKAVEIQPDDPGIVNNLAYALSLQGKSDESDALADSIPEKFPDYFFGWIISARRAMNKDDLETARKYIDKMMTRQELHVTEFSALCMCQIDFMIDDDKPEGALSWYEMWQHGYPDDPRLNDYEEKMEIVDIMAKAKKLAKFGKQRKKKKK
jgi:tetratricopeptide (TPR) repeat protein